MSVQKPKPLESIVSASPVYFKADEAPGDVTVRPPKPRSVMTVLPGQLKGEAIGASMVGPLRTKLNC